MCFSGNPRPGGQRANKITSQNDSFTNGSCGLKFDSAVSFHASVSSHEGLGSTREGFHSQLNPEGAPGYAYLLSLNEDNLHQDSPLFNQNGLVTTPVHACETFASPRMQLTHTFTDILQF